jgi:hypothetical protein
LQVPDKYILVERMDAVQIHFVFVYPEAGGAASGASLSPLAAAAPAAGQTGPQQRPAAGDQPAGHLQPAQVHHRQQQSSLSPLLVIIAAYLGWLMYVGLRDHWPLIRRMLRRKFGVRL